jgi:hypothetical protein
MRRNGIVLAVFAALLHAPPPAVAVETIRVPTDEPTIQDAIDAAESGDIILIDSPGQYSVNLTITNKTDLTIQGEETQGVVLSAKKSAEPTALVTGSTGVRFRNLSFISADTGIQITDSEETAITASVFALGSSGTAITETNATRSSIENNTFHDNKTAVVRSAGTTYVKNNIFANNTTAISDSSTATTRISFNGFYNNDSNGTVGDNSIDLDDPRFVSVEQRNFHLQAGSDAIGVGSGTVDLGAYGGSDAERVPYPVSDLAITAAPDDNVNFNVTYVWSPNLDHRLTSGTTSPTYALTYSFDGFPGVVASEGASPIAGIAAATFTISGALPAVTAPAAPDGVVASPGNARVLVRWNAVAQATRYSVHYGINSTAENTVPDIAETQLSLTGLQNGATYLISVRAQSQAVLRAAVNATAEGLSTQSPSNEVTRTLGDVYESAGSAEVSAIPEETLPYPALADEGCFIATAAYGYYDAPQVQALRNFRDRFLLTHAPGRAFVAWYYRNSPPIAEYLRSHAIANATVRVTLYPAVLLATLTTEAPAAAWLIVLIVPLIVAVRRIRPGRVT